MHDSSQYMTAVSNDSSQYMTAGIGQQVLERTCPDITDEVAKKKSLC